MLDHRAVTLNNVPAVQRKDVEELRGTLAKEQEEHRAKEMRLRLTVSLYITCPYSSHCVIT